MGDHFLSDQRVKYLNLIINVIVPDVCTHRCIFKTVLRELSFHLIIQWRGGAPTALKVDPEETQSLASVHKAFVVKFK